MLRPTMGGTLGPSNLTVVVGALSISPGQGTSYRVSRVTNHPQFSLRTMANDVSVIRTVGRIAFTNLVRAIKLPTANIADGAPTTFSGWGQVKVRTEYSFQ